MIEPGSGQSFEEERKQISGGQARVQEVASSRIDFELLIHRPSKDLSTLTHHEHRFLPSHQPDLSQHVGER